MTRQELLDLAVDEAVVDKIMRLHGKTINPLKADNEKLAADNEALSADLTKAQGEIKSITEKHENDQSSFKAKYEAEVAVRETAEKDLVAERVAHKTTRDDFAKKESDATINKVYSELLTQSGFRPDLVDKEIKLANRDALALDKDGKLKGSDKILADAKSRWPNDFADATEGGAFTFSGGLFSGNKTPSPAMQNDSAAMNAWIRGNSGNE